MVMLTTGLSSLLNVRLLLYQQAQMQKVFSKRNLSKRKYQLEFRCKRGLIIRATCKYETWLGIFLSNLGGYF